MATYAIGDIQGCYDALRCLLKKINFDSNKDTLWLTGDLVHRGGQSLETLEFIYSIRHSVVTVLGNHDLHLIAAYHGHKLLDSFSDLLPVLESPNSETLIQWLEQQPLMHYEHEHALVHAGIAPMWSLEQALSCAAEVETALRSKNIQHFLDNMYGNKPALWSDNLTGTDRLRCITNYFTRMRFINKNGKLDFKENGHPRNAAKKLMPWFDYPKRPARKTKIIMGHWAALMGESNKKRIIALDTGCVWGGQLSAYNLETKTITSCDCH